MGFNIYQTADEFLSAFLPIDGSYYSVAEPPEGIDIEKLDYALRMARISFARSKPNNELSYRLKSDSGFESFDSSEDFTSADGFRWAEVIPEELKTDSVFMGIFSNTEFSRRLMVKELDTNQRYFLVLFSPNTNEMGVSVALMINPETGAFRQASWTDKEEKYLRISRGEAIKIATKALRNKYGRPTKVSLAWSKDLSTSMFQPSYEVVFTPLHSISGRKTSIKKRRPRREIVVYVHQDGSYEVVRNSEREGYYPDSCENVR